MSAIALIGLLKIELSGGATVLLCDGGFIEFDDEVYKSADDTFGAIGSLSSLTGGIGKQIPALELTLHPATTAASSDLSQPGYQRSAVRFWVGDYDPETGLLVGDPELEFFGQIDRTQLVIGEASRELAMTIVSTLERLFMRNEGNGLSASFHKSIYPGETGHDNATGLVLTDAWGVESSQGASTAGRAAGGGFGGGGRATTDAMVNVQ